MSTAAEIAGFVCLAVAAFILNTVAGLITTGLLLVLVGYAIEDAAALLAVRRLVAPIARRRASRKQKRAEAK